MEPRSRGRSTIEISMPLVASLSLVACSGVLPSPSVIDKLRLMAILADHPEVAPGVPVQLQAVWADGSPSAPRPIFFLWRICPRGNNPDARACLTPGNGTDLGPAVVGMDHITLQPTDFPPEPAGTDTSTSEYDVLLAMCPLEAPYYDDGTGQYQCPSEQDLPQAQREGIQAVRLVTIRSSGPYNQNPPIARITLAGTDALGLPPMTVPTCPRDGNGNPQCVGVKLSVYPAVGAAELTPDGTYETLLASFFVTAGSTDRPRAITDPTNAPLDRDGQTGRLAAYWFPPSTPGMATLYFTLRDERGGQTAATVTVNVGP